MSQISDAMNRAIYKALRRVGQDFVRTLRDDEITLFVHPATFAALATDPGALENLTRGGMSGEHRWRGLLLAQDPRMEQRTLRAGFATAWTETIDAL